MHRCAQFPTVNFVTNLEKVCVAYGVGPHFKIHELFRPIRALYDPLLFARTNFGRPLCGENARHGAEGCEIEPYAHFTFTILSRMAVKAQRSICFYLR